MRTYLTIALAVVALPGCEQNDSGDPPLDLTLNWEELSDGSFVTRSGSEFDGATFVKRCWKTDEGFECLEANMLTASGGIQVAKVFEFELPTTGIPIVGNNEGYSCSLSMYPHEQISRSNQTLISNVVRPGGERWNSGYVRQYMADNDVRGIRWFPCLEVLEVVSNGSLESMATTSVTRDDLRTS